MLSGMQMCAAHCSDGGKLLLQEMMEWGWALSSLAAASLHERPEWALQSWATLCSPHSFIQAEKSLSEQLSNKTAADAEQRPL